VAVFTLETGGGGDDSKHSKCRNKDCRVLGLQDQCGECSVGLEVVDKRV
jgi:hypothetical protein